MAVDSKQMIAELIVFPGVGRSSRRHRRRLSERAWIDLVFPIVFPRVTYVSPINNRCHPSWFSVLSDKLRYSHLSSPITTA